jgi:hypothetical protein
MSICNIIGTSHYYSKTDGLLNLSCYYPLVIIPFVINVVGVALIFIYVEHLSLLDLVSKPDHRQQANMLVQKIYTEACTPLRIMFISNEIQGLQKQHNIFENVALFDTFFNKKYSQIAGKNIWLCLFSVLNANFFFQMVENNL